MFKWLRSLFTRPVPSISPTPVVDTVRVTRISEMAKILAMQAPPREKFEFKAPTLLPGVVPPVGQRGADYMALDSAFCQTGYEYANSANCGQGFMGYPYLAELSQISEYRAPSEVIANESTRKWINVISHGDGDNVAKIEKINDELKRHNVMAIMKAAVEQDGQFGRSQIFINIKGQDDPDVQKLPLIIDPRTIKKGDLVGFKNIEPLWTTPYQYNSIDPTASDFYKPSAWYILGKQTHATRLLTIISRPVPDLYKPSYNFGGLSLTQLMKPYVDSWLTTRDSIGQLIKAFSLTGLKTDLSSILGEGSGTALFDRMDMFNQMRDNKGLMIIQNGAEGDGEEFFQLNVPLSGLDALQAQSQEHMSAPCHIPLVKLLGITPTGLNANTDGEMRVFYDFINSGQENNMRAPLKTIIDIIQLDQFGSIDPAIGFEFEPLMQLDGTELAAVRKSDADAAVALINAGVISAEEERKRLASDPNSGYDSLEAEDVPEPPADNAAPIDDDE